MKEEYVDIVDKNDNVTGVVPRSEMRKKNLRHRCTFYMVFNPGGELLITKRSMLKDCFPGLYEIPGGTLETGELYEENAYREIEEELGITDPELEFLFDFIYEDKELKLISKVYKFIFEGEIKPQEEEIESYFFMHVDKLTNFIKENEKKFCMNRIKIIEKYLGMISS